MGTSQESARKPLRCKALTRIGRVKTPARAGRTKGDKNMKRPIERQELLSLIAEKVQVFQPYIDWLEDQIRVNDYITETYEPKTITLRSLSPGANGPSEITFDAKDFRNRLESHLELYRSIVSFLERAASHPDSLEFKTAMEMAEVIKEMGFSKIEDD
jgi:hypothetical protein